MNVPEQWLLVFFVGNAIFSAAVQALIPPDSTSGKGYIYFFRFLSLLATDFKSFASTLPPAPPITILKSTGTITTTSVPAAPLVTDQQAGR
jgi:hypothetical protein